MGATDLFCQSRAARGNKVTFSIKKEVAKRFCFTFRLKDPRLHEARSTEESRLFHFSLNYIIIVLLYRKFSKGSESNTNRYHDRTSHFSAQSGSTYWPQGTQWNFTIFESFLIIVLLLPLSLLSKKDFPDPHRANSPTVIGIDKLGSESMSANAELYNS